MKRLPFILISILALSQGASAQDLEGRIALTPYVDYSLDRIPQTASSSLERKLVSMTTANGFASVSGEFIITAVPSVINTSSTPTAPPQFVSEVEVAVYVLNVPEQVIVDQKVYSCKGVGASEQKSIVGAVNQINVRSTDTRRFMENVRTKILDYYADRLPAIISKAQSLAAMTRYEEALYVLSAVPESLVEYPQVADLMVDIYTQCIDRDAKKIIADAKVKTAQEDYAAAMKELVKVDPNSTLFGQADAMISDIKARMDAQKQAELQRELELYEQEKKQAQQEYEDNMELQKMKIKASRELAAKVVSGGEGDAAAAAEEKGKEVVKWLLGNLIQ